MLLVHSIIFICLLFFSFPQNNKMPQGTNNNTKWLEKEEHQPTRHVYMCMECNWCRGGFLQSQYLSNVNSMWITELKHSNAVETRQKGGIEKSAISNWWCVRDWKTTHGKYLDSRDIRRKWNFICLLIIHKPQNGTILREKSTLFCC